jgi:hypothetical protein
METPILDPKTPETIVPVGLVPTPTNQYRQHRKQKAAIEASGLPTHATVPLNPPIQAAPIPLPILTGSRVLIYKQDPSVAEIGIRKVYLSSFVSNGPQDLRFKSMGLTPVSKNAFGDFIQTPNTDAFDSVQAFSVARLTLTMVQRVLALNGLPSALPWQWNSATNIDPLQVHAHGLPDVMNAYYSRSLRSVKFGDFVAPGTTNRIFTCRSLDIVSHETGHAILDSLKPSWILAGSPPQTGGLHESFGDLMAIFLTLSQYDQVEAIIAQTKANLHDKTFLSDLAEQFGLALGRPNGLRNADNDFKLSQVGTEVHAISQVFTGGIYDVLADIFAFERNITKKDDAQTLHECAQYLLGLLLRAIIAAPNTAATFASVVNQMLLKCFADGKPVQYRTFIRNRFTLREVVVSPTPLTTEYKDGTELKAFEHESLHKTAVQDRSTCCGTMKNDEYFDIENYLKKEEKELKEASSKKDDKED